MKETSRNSKRKRKSDIIRNIEVIKNIYGIDR